MIIPSTENRGPVEQPAPTVMADWAMILPMMLDPAPMVTAEEPTFHHTFTEVEATFTMTTLVFAPKVRADPMLKIQNAFALCSASKVMVESAPTVRAEVVEKTPDLKILFVASEMIIPVPYAVASALATTRSVLA